MDRTDYIVECVRNNTPFIFCKFGDGEYFCMCKFSEKVDLDRNCDNDNFTRKLSNGLVESFKYITTKQNVLVGKWIGDNYDKTSKYYDNLVNHEVLWTDYDTLIFDYHEIETDNPEQFLKKIRIYKEIQNSKTKKIYICNNLLIKSEFLLGVDNFVFVPLNSWFDNQFIKILNEVNQLIPENEKCIIMTSCGMSAKVLITELYKLHPNCIYIDIGSGLDLICTKRNSRGFASYKNIHLKFKEFYGLPQEWYDPKYNYLYKEANLKFGTHIPKTLIYDEINDNINQPKYSSIFEINSNNFYQYYLVDTESHNFIAKFCNENNYFISFKSKYNGKIRIEYEVFDDSILLNNNSNVHMINKNFFYLIVNSNSETKINFTIKENQKIVLKNLKFTYGTTLPKFYENIVFISSKIYVSSKPFTYTNVRSIYSPETRYEQTIKTIDSVRKFIPNCYIVLFDNSEFTPDKLNILRVLTDLFINETNDPIINYYTNECENKAYGEICQTYYTLKQLTTIEFKNFFKISGRYLINESFDYSLYNNDFNIFKKNPIITQEYYTSFYKISWSNYKKYFSVVSKLFNEIQSDNNIYYDIPYEVFFPSKLEFNKVDYLGITEIIAVKNSINYI